MQGEQKADLMHMAEALALSQALNAERNLEVCGAAACVYVLCACVYVG